MSEKETKVKFTWLKGRGPESDIAISSRARLARNLEKLPFPQWAKDEELEEAKNLIKKALFKEPKLREFSFIPLEKLSEWNKKVLVEEHLISPQFQAKAKGYALALGKEKKISIMINEEDHLRIQSLLPGLQLFRAWQQADEIDNYLSLHLKLAFSEKWGYLTVCPTNVGTALRVSVMMHLPALFMSKQVSKLFSTLSQVGVTVRGLFGEGTKTLGNLYQISNQITLGCSENEIVKNLNGVARQVIQRERTARKILLKNARTKILDRAQRAIGILSHARIISFEEALELLSMLRLGIDLELVRQVDTTCLNELTILTRPAHLQSLRRKDLSPEEQDIARADLIREKLNF